MPLFPQSLLPRLVLIQLAYGVLVGASFVAALELTHTRVHLEASQRQALEWAGKVAAALRPVADGSGLPASSALQRFLADAAALNPSADFYVVDREGVVLASSRKLDSLQRRSVDVAVLQAMLSRSPRLPLSIPDPVSPSVSRVFSVTELRGPPDTTYFLMVLLGPSAAAYQSAQSSYALRESLLGLAALIATGLLAAMAILLVLLSPLRRLTRSIRAFERRDKAPPERGAKDDDDGSELGHFGRFFNRGTQRIAVLVKELSEKDRKTREMFAGISHDLRTPLTLIRGYLDTALCQTGALAEKCGACRHLLQAACLQTESATGLVEKVLELAKLQTADYPLRLEIFPVVELLHHVAEKFAVKAEGSGMTIRVAHEGAPWVRADARLVERVLDNLVGNAIAHAAGAKAVTIRVQGVAADTKVIVEDDGPGLPAGVLERLDGPLQDRPCPEYGRAGLGLTIVQRILELHGSRLVGAQCGISGARLSFALSSAGELR